MTKEKGTNEEVKEEAKEEAQADEPQKTEETKTFTQEDLDKLITNRLAREQKKWEAELDKLRKVAEQEKMTEEEKRQAVIAEKEKELQEKEGTIRQRELTLKAIDLLHENKVPLEYKDFILGADEEETEKRLKALLKLRQQDIEQAVDGRFKDGGIDPHKRNTAGKHFTREQVRAMSPSEVQANLKEIEESMTKW